MEKPVIPTFGVDDIAKEFLQVPYEKLVAAYPQAAGHSHEAIATWLATWATSLEAKDLIAMTLQNSDYVDVEKAKYTQKMNEELAVYLALGNAFEKAAYNRMHAAGGANLSVPGVGVLQGEEKLAFTPDWAKFSEFAAKNGGIEWTQRRVNTDKVKEYMAANDGKLPDGLTVKKNFVVIIKRAAASKRK